MRRKRAIVTGGAGFLGSHLSERLLLDGWWVLGIDNFVTGLPDNVGHLGALSKFHLREGDVTGPLQIPGPVDAVFHLASPASPSDYLRLPIETLKVGSIGTLNALELAADKGARFLLASTSEVYGDPLVHPQPETYWGNVNPVGPRGGLRRGQALRRGGDDGLPQQPQVSTPAIVRIFNTYGPRMRPRRRPGHSDLHRPGPARRADHGDRRWLPDPVAVLRRRPRRAASSRMLRCRASRTGQPRQPSTS